MKKFLPAVLGVLSLIVFVAAAPLMRSESTMVTVTFTSSATTPYQVNAPANLPAGYRDYNEVCWMNEGADSSKVVRISSFSTTNDTLYGWPVRGTEKECHDWTPNVPLWVYHGSTGVASRMTFMFSR